MDPLNVLSTTKYVLDNAQHVSLDTGQINKLVPRVKSIIEQGMDDAMGFKESKSIKNDVQLMIIEDVLNFCFWSHKDQVPWAIEWPRGSILKGGWFCLHNALKRALVENIPLLDPAYLSQISLADLKKIFRSANETGIPLLKTRQQHLQELGKVLLKKYDGLFINAIEEAQFDAVLIAKLIYTNLDSFKDIEDYKRKKVYILKRAQISPNSLSYLKSITIKNLNKLTAFADYKIPQMLRMFKILNYSLELAQKIDSYTEIPQGSEEEIEIRAASIWGVELIKQQLPETTAADIDNALWLMSQDVQDKAKPYHRTRSPYY